MSNKKIYKGLNKRRKFNFRKFITIILCMTLIVGYTYKKIKLDQVLKNINIEEASAFVKDKLYFWRDLGLGVFDIASNDIKKSDILSNESENLSQNTSSNEKTGGAKNTEVAVVDGIDVYLIQVGSFDNDKDLNDMKSKLEKNKIPNGTLKIDGVNKTQAYISFKEQDMRNKLDTTRDIFEDAFLAKLEIPVLSLEYTDKYSYMKDISDNLNSLLDSYEEESNYLNANRNNLDSIKYQEILLKRKNILDNLDNQVKKINYKELESFKSNLLSYTSQIRNNISNYKVEVNQKSTYKCESLLISDIQMYYEFINKIKTV